MKYHKWTLGLAAMGAVSLASTTRAEEQPAHYVQTAMSTTTLSGFVDTSMQWNPGTGNSHAPAYSYGGPAKADGFNLNSVQVILEKPMNEDYWASGYKVDLFFGPDANSLGTTSTGAGASDFAVKQAYVTVQLPVGNGVKWKLGVFDTIIGYEAIEGWSNPNFTRSWGYTIEPSTHTGLLGSYQFNDNYNLELTAGIANTASPAINARGFLPQVQPAAQGAGPVKAESYKTYMASLSATAPDSWGFLAGSTLYGGVVNGYGATLGANRINLYVGSTIATPIKKLSLGLAYDYAGVPSGQSVAAGTPAGTPPPAGVGLFAGRSQSLYANAVAGYASYQLNGDVSLHGRVEYASQSRNLATAGQLAGSGVPAKVLSLTGTVQYDLWKNVISRLELRWDHAVDGRQDFGDTSPYPVTPATTATGTLKNSVIVAANLIYKF